MAFSREEVEKMYRADRQDDQWITVEFSTQIYLNKPAAVSMQKKDEIFDAIEQWCKDVGFEKYKYDINDLRLGFIHFFYEEDAILFKTTWC